MKNFMIFIALALIAVMSPPMFLFIFLLWLLNRPEKAVEQKPIRQSPQLRIINGGRDEI